MVLFLYMFFCMREGGRKSICKALKVPFLAIHCRLRAHSTGKNGVIKMYLTLTIQLCFAAGVIKMVASLTTCSTEQQRAVIRFLWAEEGVRLVEFVPRFQQIMVAKLVLVD
jgi:hypothetical protein